MPDLVAVMYWTVRISVLFYAGALGILLGVFARSEGGGVARLFWTAGAVLLIVHVLLAFHVVHGWSHADAVRQTAEQTAKLTGVRAGAGVYLNYLFAAVWAADAAYWWRVGHAGYRRRPRAVTWAVHGFLLFIVFNATIVFAAGPTRYAGTAVALALAAVAARRWRRAATVPTAADCDARAGTSI